MTNITWRDCGYNYTSGGGNRRGDYDVLVTTTVSSRVKRSDKPWAIYDISFTFRGKALDVIKRNRYVAVQISTIIPNVTAIAIKFLTAEEAERSRTHRFMSSSNNGSAMVVRFPFANKTEYQVVDGYWANKKYTLSRDYTDDFYHIRALGEEV